MDQKSDFWDTARHDSLSAREKGIYSMIDTIQTLPAFKNLHRYYNHIFYRI
jgi:hypothetical protein